MINKTFLLAIVCSLLTGISFAQWVPGKYMRQATNRALSTAAYLEKQSSTFGMADGLCFLGALLKKNGGYSEFNLYLSSSSTYLFVGGGDDDASDIDISIKNSAGTTLASDSKNDNYPVVRFTPGYSGTYTIRLLNYSSSLAFCALTILKTGGYTMNTSNISDAADRIFTVCNNINNRESRDVIFHNYDNQWCFYGYYISQGEDQAVTNINMGYENHYFIASSDYRASDIDLCLMNNNASSSIKCDVESDATPVVNYVTYSSSNYGIKLKNVRSNGKSFLLTCILTIK